jgi:hypothetical protein
METKKIESLQAQVSRLKKIGKDRLGEGIWGLKKEYNKFTHEEIVFLFARIFYALGFDYVKKVRTEFPDCICYREGQEIGIEFEPILSQFKEHIRKHNLDLCQYIICWEDDLETYDPMIDEIKEKHIKVIELKKIYEEQKILDRYFKSVITQADIDKLRLNQLKALKAFIESGKDILTKKEISHEIGIYGKGLGGVLKGFTELAKRKIGWIVRQTPDRKWEINPEYKNNIKATLKDRGI